MSKIKVNWNFGAVRQVEQAVATALEQTAQAVITDVVDEQVMPMDTGTLQNSSTFVETSESSTGVVGIISDTPYARRLYYHPEYNFRTSENKNAGGKWFQPWIDGDKKEFAADAFAKLLRQNLK
ncbi:MULTISPECIES: hypothetical protein [Ruminococcus]|jgi:hypothetical protein|uniref:hypothetical protein n=1 Tax=Ruminococcus TaxID=1263 RepID=UPI000ED0A864|nr:hypothetical protein [Ruminococcus sp.]